MYQSRLNLGVLASQAQQPLALQKPFRWEDLGIELDDLEEQG